jgi:hypothetical protein
VALEAGISVPVFDEGGGAPAEAVPEVAVAGAVPAGPGFVAPETGFDGSTVPIAAPALAPVADEVAAPDESTFAGGAGVTGRAGVLLSRARAVADAEGLL